MGTTDGAGRPDGTVDASVTYPALSDMSAWSTFDLSMLSTSQAGQYNGVVYDGRYVYYAPFGPEPTTWSTLARVDTQGDFTALSSWAAFDLTTVAPGASGFRGVAFDGTHLTFAPSFENPMGTAVRYTTTGALAQPASYEALVLTASDPAASSYYGAIFDGRYVYLAPDSGMGEVVRFDTTLPFTSFDHFSLSGVTPEWGYHGGLYDGRYVYFVPYQDQSGVCQGTVARYDTSQPFATAASWTTIDLTTINPMLCGLVGAAFDGRFLYLVPNTNTVAARYDTTLGFANTSSWTSLDFEPLFQGTHYRGGAFDGRYVYFVPEYGTVGGHLVLARLDTTAGGFDASAFESFDLQNLPIGGGGYVGAAFDGQYLYVSPEGGTVALRFLARTPRGPLTTAGGSFL
jgi:hypothetical protein